MSFTSSETITQRLRTAINFHQAGDYTNAESIYHSILQSDPKNHDALHLLGLIATEHGNFLIARGLIQQAIAINPDSAIYYTNLGICLHRSGHYWEAISNFDFAILLKPDFFDAYYNRGNAFVALGEHTEAFSNYQIASQIQPASVISLFNCGASLQCLRRYEEALIYYDKALAIQSDYTDAARSKALTLIHLGDYQHGFALFEQRWQHKDFSFPPSTFGKTLWKKDIDLKGKTILLHSEQGLGDSLQFCRYATLVSRLGATVILEVERPLKNLLSTLEGVSSVYAKGEPLPSFDFHCPFLNLPVAFNTSTQTVPSAARYLHSTEGKRAFWSEKLGPKIRPRVGIAWSGGQVYATDNTRSIKLAEFLQFLPAGLQYISLQKEVRPYDLETLESRPEILHFGEDQNDFSDAAAMIDLLDIVISVDTSIGHLSGALGKPTATLLAYNDDWRWIVGRDDSPWYPSTKLFRQDRPNDWASAFAKLRKALFNHFYQTKQ